MFKKIKSQYIKKSEHDEIVEAMNDRLAVESSLANSEISSLKEKLATRTGQLTESDEKYEFIISKFGKLLDENFVVVEKGKYHSMKSSLGGLKNSVQIHQKELDQLKQSIKSYKKNISDLEKKVNNYETQFSSFDSENKSLKEENDKLKQIVSDLSNPKNPPSSEKLFEYKYLSKNGQGKLTKRNK